MMKQRATVFLAAGMTAFVLVAAGAVMAAATVAPSTTVAAQQLDVTATLTGGLDVPVVDATVVAQREAQYRQLIEQANARIQQANAEIARLQQAQSQAQTAPSGLDAAPQITADQAAQLALSLVNGSTLVSTPELVNYQGATAYEVVLDRGNIYIDPTTNRLLGAVAAGQTSSPGPDDH